MFDKFKKSLSGIDAGVFLGISVLGPFLSQFVYCLFSDLDFDVLFEMSVSDYALRSPFYLLIGIGAFASSKALDFLLYIIRDLILTRRMDFDRIFSLLIIMIAATMSITIDSSSIVQAVGVLILLIVLILATALTFNIRKTSILNFIHKSAPINQAFSFNQNREIFFKKSLDYLEGVSLQLNSRFGATSDTILKSQLKEMIDANQREIDKLREKGAATSEELQRAKHVIYFFVFLFILVGEGFLRASTTSDFKWKDCHIKSEGQSSTGHLLLSTERYHYLKSGDNIIKISNQKIISVTCPVSNEMVVIPPSQ